MAATLLAGVPLHAQLVADGATNTLSNVTNTITGTVTVGTNGSFTLLTLGDNTLLTNSLDGVIGRNATAKSNEVQLVSGSARWQMGGSLFLGSNGAFNRLVVSNGASVRNASTYLGFLGSAINNLALITGSGSVWTNGGPVFLGFLGAGNQLVVSNGGVLRNDAQAFIGADLNSSNNLAVVTGSGSTWTNALELRIGIGGAGNQLLVSEGGTARNGHGIVGSNEAASNNVALITGSGSVWSNALDLAIGDFGANNNRMIVSNGATVYAAGLGLIGAAANANGNSVTVTDVGTRWLLGNNLYVGSNGAFSTLVVSNGAFVDNNSGILGSRVGSSNNFALVTGGGSLWSNRLGLTVGVSGRDNQLIVSNGARVVTQIGTIGQNPGSSNNLIMVTGDGSVWTNHLYLNVGENERNNRLVIEAGGQVWSEDGRVGAGFPSDGSEALVTGPGSLWSNRADLAVGLNGANSRLVVSNGASAVMGNNGRVGVVTGATNNMVVVTGSGSLWSNQFELYVGEGGPRNRMEVNDGGRVVGSNTYVGYFGAGNFALATGAGSLWSNRAGMFVGHSSSANQLVVSNGATLVIGGDGVVGLSSGANSNTMTLTDPGTRLLGGDTDLRVGTNGAFNVLVISNGASALGVDVAELGFNTGAVSNSAVITGAGSRLLTRLNTMVGRNGAGNRLTISEGGFVDCNSGVLGLNPGGSNNQVIVTGTGSVWSNRVDLYVGNLAPGNRLVISNGGFVHNNGFGFIGVQPASSSNLVIVTGSGSTWNNVDDLVVGDIGPGNRLVVSDGGRVANLVGFIGANPSSSNNEAVITGPGSLWTMTNGALVLGDSTSRGNRLVVSNGAAVNCVFGWIGFSSTPGPNEALVTGAGSSWINLKNLTVGQLGSASRLVVSNAAIAFAHTNIVLGGSVSSTNNRVVVDGGTLRATNILGTGMLDVRRGTNLLNAGLIDVDQLRLTNSQGFFEFKGGLLITRGAIISSGAPFVVGRSGTTPAIWDVRAGTTDHVLADNLHVGDNSSFNQLLITNDASVFVGRDAVLGVNNSASNTATVTGAGTLWSVATNLFVGSNSPLNRLFIGNGAFVSSLVTTIGYTFTADTNEVLVAGAGTIWSNASQLTVGWNGSGNRLAISNGAVIHSFQGFVGASIGGSNNSVVISDPGSAWTNRNGFVLGANGAFNRLLVANGGRLHSTNGAVGGFDTATNNEVIITGAGSAWNNVREFEVGGLARANRVTIENGGTLTASDAVVGDLISASNNLVLVDGGMLLVTNLAGTGLLEIRRGTNVLNAGLIEMDIWRLTNGTLSKFEFNGGTLSVKSSRVSVGNPVFVGNGVSPATFNLAGNGTHDMSGTLGLIVSSNAMLTGNGSLIVQLQVLPGATLSPGASVGKISVSTAPSLSGSAVMEISKSGATLTNDQFQVTGTLTYGGTLVVSNLGPSTLAAGDRFPLFSATSYAGSFASITLPPLPSPLSWNNKLLVDGSIEVMAPPAIAMSSGTYTQSFDSLSMSGSSNPWRDNVTLLGWYAAKSVAPSNITTYIAADGSANNGALYSFGSTGSGERALGSIGSDAVGIISYGLCFTNDTGASISNVTITFTGEQWRDGSSGNSNTLTFWFRVSATALTNPEPGVVTNWIAVTNLNFISPTVLGSATALDGNQATNRQTFASAFISGLAVTPGQTVFLRWQDLNDIGTDQGMAVDDLIVTFAPLLPEITFIASNPTNGVIQITGQGESNQIYRLEAATGLSAPVSWKLVSSNTADDAGLFQFTDTNAPAFPIRFYRVLSP